jgi:hypothetical protein
MFTSIMQHRTAPLHLVYFLQKNFILGTTSSNNEYRHFYLFRDNSSLCANKKKFDYETLPAALK